MNRMCSLLYILASAALSTAAYGQVANEGINLSEGEIVFEPSASFTIPNSVGEDVVDSDKLSGRGAAVVDFSQFPEIHVATSRGSLCTASVIGPRTVLLAAHCVDDIDIIRILGVRAKCDISPAYDPNTRYGRTADYALCSTNADIPSVLFGSVKMDNNGVSRGNYLLLSGVGCTEWKKRDGKLRVGHARIVSVPASASNDIVLEWDKVYFGGAEGAALCPGDSGGPAFYLTDVNKFTPRFIAGVNARSAAVCVPDPRIDPRDCPGDDVKILGTSYVSSLASDEAKRFFTAWIENKSGRNREICGFNYDGPKCLK